MKERLPGLGECRIWQITANFGQNSVASKAYSLYASPPNVEVMSTMKIKGLARSLTLFLMVAAGSGLRGATHSTSPPTSTVHLKCVIPAGGMELGPAIVALFRSEQGQDYAKQFHDGSASSIPYGIYHLRASTIAFYDTVEREVLVLEPEVWVVVGMQFGMGWDEGGGPVLVTGKIDHLPPKPSDLWVRMTGITSSFIGDAKVDESGGFSIVGLLDDRCLLVVRQGAKVLYTGTVSVSRDQKRLTIELP